MYDAIGIYLVVVLLAYSFFLSEGEVTWIHLAAAFAVPVWPIVLLYVLKNITINIIRLCTPHE